MHYHIGQRPVAHLIPGLSVSVGVVGTFLGLTFGLFGLHGGTTDSLKSGIFQLFSGMESAFITSVVGILLAVAWTIIDKRVGSTLESEIDYHVEI